MTLTPQDLNTLEHDSWIDQATAERFGLRRVNSIEGADLVGRTAREDYAGIVFPIYWPGDSKPREHHLRRDHPPMENGKPKQKYLAPPGRPNMLLFGPDESAEALNDTTVPIVLVEGLKKLVASYRLVRHDSAQPRFLACAISGVWNWRGTIGKTVDPSGARVDDKGVIPDFDRVKWDGRKVVVIFDSDCATNDSVAAARRGLRAELKKRGARAVAVDLPMLGGLDKTGFDDLLAAWGPERVLEWMATAPDVMAAAPNPGPFRIEGGRIVRVKQTKDGPVTEPLCNFSATVTEEIALDDGAEVTRAFLLSGRLNTGEALPPARVPVAKFASMTWVTEHYGVRAIVRAGSTCKDYLREAIQHLSPGAPRRQVFTHTGWREIDGQFHYLHAGGAIGCGAAPRCEVDLGPDLARYVLPATPSNIREAVRASLNLLHVAPLSVTTLLWAGTYRAPLASAKPLDLSLWIEGQTGSLKSTIVALFLSHFGNFDRTNLTPWSSTANQLERRAFLLKDAPFVIDDWAPSALDARELDTKAARLLRAQGNLAGRGRLRADLSERPGFPPRGMIVSTGEQHPAGQSLLARVLFVELHREGVNLPALTAAQHNKQLLSHAMAGYLQWLAPQMPSLPALLADSFEAARERATSAGEHMRVSEAVAHCWIGFDCGLQFAEEVGAVSPSEAAKIREEGWAALCHLGAAQAGLVEELRPTRQFLTTLAAVLAQGKVRLRSREDPYPADMVGEIIGWADVDFVYLLPESSYRAVAMFSREAGHPFATSLDRLKRDFAKEGLSQCEEGRNTITSCIGGKTKRVLKLDRRAVEQVIEQDLPITTITGVQE